MTHEKFVFDGQEPVSLAVERDNGLTRQSTSVLFIRAVAFKRARISDVVVQAVPSR